MDNEKDELNETELLYLSTLVEAAMLENKKLHYRSLNLETLAKKLAWAFHEKFKEIE